MFVRCLSILRRDAAGAAHPCPLDGSKQGIGRLWIACKLSWKIGFAARVISSRKRVCPLRKLMGKSSDFPHGFSCKTIETAYLYRFPSVFLANAGQIGIHLVEWADGNTTNVKQHEHENSSQGLHPGGSFLGCAGRRGGDSFHDSRACRCAACQNGAQRAFSASN